MSEPHECSECKRVFRWGRDADSHLGAKAGGTPGCGDNAYWKLCGHMSADHPGVGFQCGRRGDEPGGKLDFWQKRDGHKACSYCGSISPEELFAAIAAGCKVTPTDKSYKIYCDVPLDAGGTAHAKFYFQHLDQAGKDRFLELYNTKAMALAIPGYFYVTPYFARAAANEAAAV